MSSIWDTPGATTPAAPSGNAGGSIWDSPGSTSVSTQGAPAAHSGGGGFLHAITNAGHWIASKASIAGHDIKGIPGGIVNQTEAGVNDLILPHLPHFGGVTIGGKQWYDVGLGNTKSAPHLQGVATQMGKSAIESAKHPLRDPFQTAMWLVPGLHGAGRVGAGAVEAGAALRAGEGLNAAAKAAREPKILNTPRTLTRPGGEPVSMEGSKNSIRRMYQVAHDNLVQKAINEKPESALAKYGASRMHGTLSEVTRSRVRMRQAVVSNLRRASANIGNVAKGVDIKLVNSPKTISQAAIELVSHNTTPEEAILRAEHAIEHGVNPELNQGNVRLYQEIQHLDLVHTLGREVGINPKFAGLAKAEEILNRGATSLDEQIAQRNLRPEAQLENRKNMPAAVTTTLKPLEEVKVTPALRSARADFGRVDKAYQKALTQEAAWRNGEGPKNAKGPQISPGGKIAEGTPEQSNPYRNRVVSLGIRHEAALERLNRIEDHQGLPKTGAPVVEQGPVGPTPAETLQSEHGVAPEVAHAAITELVHGMPELLQRKVALRYGGDPEKFANDMLGVHNGTVTDPESVRMFHQLTDHIPGRSFTPLSTLENGVSASPMARTQGPVVGLATDPLNSHLATGKGLLSGMHQADVVDAVANHWHNVFRFFNTQEWRGLVAKTGSATRQSTRDILVRVDDRTEGGTFQPKAVGKLTAEAEQLVGKKRSTAYTPEMEGEAAGVMASLQQYVEHLFPGRDPHSAEAALEASAPAGYAAPKGMKWVDGGVVGNLDLPKIGAGHIVGRYMDEVNKAVTGATVYFKLGHFGTRYLTNAVTNIIQGSATPLSIKEALGVWHDLTPDEHLDALAAAGTHYYEALPGAEGQSRISRVIQHGIGKQHVLSPQWWAGYVDAPFRFNSLAYEVRKSAYGAGTEAFRNFLGDLKDYNNLDPAQRAEVDGVVRRANREAIAYDRLGPNEKTYLSRAIWFYPWVKGSTVWTANTLFEHPFKSAYAVQTGVQGRKEQQSLFGDLPSYSYGIFQFANGKPFPLVADFNTFNPAGTAGDLLQLPAHEEGLAGMANPTLGYIDSSAHSQNSKGQHVPHPWVSNLTDLVSSAPETQIAQAYLGRNTDQSHREYPGGPQNDPWSKTWLGETLRMLLGPGAPRRFNPDAAHSLADRERTGR